MDHLKVPNPRSPKSPNTARQRTSADPKNKTSDQPRKVQLRDFQKSWRKFKQEVSVFYEAQAFSGGSNLSFGSPGDEEPTAKSVK